MRHIHFPNRIVIIHPCRCRRAPALHTSLVRTLIGRFAFRRIVLARVIMIYVIIITTITALLLRPLRHLACNLLLRVCGINHCVFCCADEPAGEIIVAEDKPRKAPLAGL